MNRPESPKPIATLSLNTRGAPEMKLPSFASSVGVLQSDRALFRVERDQAAIVRADEQSSLGVREPANAGTGAQFLARDQQHVRIEAATTTFRLFASTA